MWSSFRLRSPTSLMISGGRCLLETKFDSSDALNTELYLDDIVIMCLGEIQLENHKHLTLQLLM